MIKYVVCLAFFGHTGFCMDANFMDKIWGGALEWPGGHPKLMQLNREEYCGYENRPRDAYYNGEVYCPAANSEPIKKKWAEKRW